MSLPPVRREIHVSADPDLAFTVFTGRISTWWPLATHSVHGAGGTVSFDRERIVERSASGDESVWGRVLRWEPGKAVEFTWHPGSGSEQASQVEVTFTATEEGTLVVLSHHGWEVYAEPEAARSEYNKGWVGVLDRYAATVNEGARADG